MNKRAITLTELIIVLSIILTLAAIIVPSTMKLIEKGRDAHRLADMNVVQIALESYYNANNGTYPAGDGLGCNGWDTPATGGFIQVLKTDGYIPSDIRDPVADNNCANYLYIRCGINGCGCASTSGFYILGIANMETNYGTYVSPGFNCTGGLTPEWVSGRYE